MMRNENESTRMGLCLCLCGDASSSPFSPLIFHCCCGGGARDERKKKAKRDKMDQKGEPLCLYHPIVYALFS